MSEAYDARQREVRALAAAESSAESLETLAMVAQFAFTVFVMACHLYLIVWAMPHVLPLLRRLGALLDD